MGRVTPVMFGSGGEDTVGTTLIKPETFEMPWKMAEVDAPRCTIVTSVSCSSKVYAQTCGANQRLRVPRHGFQNLNTLSRLFAGLQI